MEHSKKLIAFTLTAMVLTCFCIAPVAATSSPNVASTSLAVPFVFGGGIDLGIKAVIFIAGVLGLTAVKEDLEHHVNLNENTQKVFEEFTSWLSSLSGWVHADSNEAQMLFEIDNAFYNSYAPIGPNGKKPDELEIYHEARVTQDRKNVEIKKEAITKKEAIKLLKHMKKDDRRGVFSPNQKAADDLYKAITGKEPPEKPDLHHGGIEGYYPHYHIDGVHTSHIWMPKK